MPNHIVLIVSDQYFDPNPVLVNANKLKVYHTLQGHKIVPIEAPRGLVADLRGKEGVITNNEEKIQDGKLKNQGTEGSVGEEDDKSAQISTPRSTGFGQISIEQETLRGRGNEENSTVTTCAIIVVENRLQEAKIRIKHLWVEEILKKLAYSQKKDEKIKLIGEESDRIKYSRILNLGIRGKELNLRVAARHRKESLLDTLSKEVVQWRSVTSKPVDQGGDTTIKRVDEILFYESKSVPKRKWQVMRCILLWMDFQITIRSLSTLTIGIRLLLPLLGVPLFTCAWLSSSAVPLPLSNK